MKTFFRFFAQRHLLANLITIMIMLLGIVTLSNIKRDNYPDVDYGYLVITTEYPGASPEDVELNVTNKIEEELKTVAGLKEVVSISMENVSLIKTVVDINVRNQDQVKMEVREAVNRVNDLPADVDEAPYIHEWKTGNLSVMEVGITGNIPYKDLREYARIFEKKLDRVPGVARIERYGYRDREIRIEVSPDKVHEYKVSLGEIIEAIKKRNIRSTAGTFESFTTEKNIVTLAEFGDPLEVGDVIIRSSYESPLIKVRDIATIRDGFEDEQVLTRVNGLPAISFVIRKKEGSDVIRTSNEVKKLIEKENEHLPEGVQLIIAADTSRNVKNRFDVLFRNALIGLSLVLVLLTLFLNYRASFWVALGIPVAILGTIFMMPLFGIFLDSLTISAMIMVVGIIVDDAIIIAENIFKHRENGKSPIDSAVDGIVEVFWPVMTTIITTFCAFAPMFFMSGLFGKFTRVVPIIICLALFVSLIEVFLALPAHIVSGLRQDMFKQPERNWFNGVRNSYHRILPKVLSWRYPIITIFIAALIGTYLFATNHMTFVLFPSKMAEEFYVMAELPRGSSLPTTAEKVKEIEVIVSQLPKDEIVSYVTRIGENPFLEAQNESYAYLTIGLTPFSQRSRSATKIVEQLRQQTDQLEGFDNIHYSIETGGPPVGKPFMLHIVGGEDKVRADLANQVVDYLESFEAVSDIVRDDKLGKDQIVLGLDYERLSRLGLTVADIARNARIAFDGEVVTSIRDGDEDVEFRVINNQASRQKPRYLEELQIPNKQGKLITMNKLATLNTSASFSNFQHYERERAITIRADVDKKRMAPVEVMNAVFKKFDTAGDWSGIQLLKGGEPFETEKSVQSLMKSLWVAIVGIYFVLIVLFNSLFQPLLVLTAVPFAMMGVVFVHAIHGEPISFLGMAGVIGLAGVAVNDSLVLVNHVNALIRTNKDKTLIEVVAQGSADRLRAIIITTLTTVVGLLPLAYGLGGTDPFVAPMALVLGFGLIFATPLTLTIIPCLYIIIYDITELLKNRKIKKIPDDEPVQTIPSGN